MPTPLFDNPILYDNLSQSYSAVNSAALRLEAFSYRVLSISKLDPPANPSNCDSYITPDESTGVWQFFSPRSLVSFIDGGWRRFDPFDGLILYVVDQQKPIVFVNGNWRDLIETGTDANSDTTVLVEALADIPFGHPVSIYSFNEATNRCQVIPYDPDVSPALGVSEDIIESNQTGRILLFGAIDGIDLTEFQVGSILYATPTGLSDIRPTTGFRQPLARVVSPSQMRVNAGYPEPDASDVAYGLTNVADALAALKQVDDDHLQATDPHHIASTPLTFTNKIIRDYSNEVSADNLHYRVKNSSGSTITKGQPVAYAGFNSGENAIEVIPSNHLFGVAVGVAQDNISVGSFGMIVAAGLLEQVDTSAYPNGSILYAINGSLSATEPSTGFSQPIAFVLRSHANNGALQILAAYPKQSADDVRFDNTTSGLVANHVQAAIDEVVASALGIDLSGKVDKIGVDDVRITNPLHGLILTDANGVAWRFTVDTDGAIRSTATV